MIELLVVLAVVGLLLAIAVPRYFQSEQRAREKVLQENLHRMREAIQQYYADKGRYPAQLEVLAREKYLRQIPIDPMTESPGTWVVVSPGGIAAGGIHDVRSGAPGRTADGKAFSEL
jgi:general secretion pathway protein G